jgi:transketolase
MSQAVALPLTQHSESELKEIARRMRRDIINMLTEAGSGHPGGSLSSVEILASLYFGALRHNPNDPAWPERDRFILSKAHCVPVLYVTLAECGYFPMEELSTLRKVDSRLQGHSMAGSPPGVEMSGGSLGQGLSFAIGQALAGRLDNADYRVYCLLGDGELDEGQCWEAAMAASYYRLDRLTAFVDRNRVQNDDFADKTMNTEPLAEKWRAFGWHAIEVDGHEFPPILDALAEAHRTEGKPTVIICHTVKGKGVSFMENSWQWHGTAPTLEQAQQALAEIG